MDSPKVEATIHYRIDTTCAGSPYSDLSVTGVDYSFSTTGPMSRRELVKHIIEFVRACRPTIIRVSINGLPELMVSTQTIEEIVDVATTVDDLVIE